VPLSRVPLGVAQERLTIRLPNRAGASDLRIEWASTALSVPITSRR